MKKLIILGVIILFLVGAYFIFFSGEKQIDVLVFSKTEGFRHQSIEAGIEAVQKLGEENNFRVEATEDAS